MAEDNDSGMDDSFEVLDISGSARGNNVVDRALTTISSYVDKYPVATKAALGGTGGYITGFVFKKVGKTAASAVGGGLVLLQIAHRAGYITINTQRVNRDARRFERRVRNEIRRNQSTMTSFLKKGEEFIRTNSPAALGFAAGFLIGLST